MLKRIKALWTWLTKPGARDWNKVTLPKKIYVYPAESNPNKFVQLLVWRDSVLALDAEGKIWSLKSEYPGDWFTVQYVQDSPPRRYQ